MSVVAAWRLGLSLEHGVGTAVAELHAGYESGAQRRSTDGMRTRWSRTYEQLSVDNLTQLMLGFRLFFCEKESL